jgi:uncharacterized membrane protein YpjA
MAYLDSLEEGTIVLGVMVNDIYTANNDLINYMQDKYNIRLCLLFNFILGIIVIFLCLSPMGRNMVSFLSIRPTLLTFPLPLDILTLNKARVMILTI